MQLKIIFSSSEEEQSLDSGSLIWFDVILIFANALMWNVALVAWILNIFGANRVTDPLLCFFSWFWQRLYLLTSPLPLRLLCARSSQLSFQWCWAPTVTRGRWHPWVLVTPLPELLGTGTEPVTALWARLFSHWWFSHLLAAWFVRFSFWGFRSSGQLLKIFMVSPFPYYLIFSLSTPCNGRITSFLCCNWSAWAQPLVTRGTIWELRAWRDLRGPGLMRGNPLHLDV